MFVTRFSEMCVCVCVCERERERKRKAESERTTIKKKFKILLFKQNGRSK